jgi:hypothetical protein
MERSKVTSFAGIYIIHFPYLFHLFAVNPKLACKEAINKSTSDSLKLLVCKSKPLPVQLPSSIIQNANALGVKYLAISRGTILIPLG